MKQDEHSKQREALNKAIESHGGISMLARTLGLKGHAVMNHWRFNRVPADYCPAIEAATNGLVRCEDLRPDVAWGVLRGNAATTPASTAQAATKTVAV